MNTFLSRRVASCGSSQPVQYHPGRCADLDLLRFIFFLMVFGAHTNPFTHLGWVVSAGGDGVCFFFMLSAFLLTDLLMRERTQTHSVHVGSFLLRRALRIVPLYLLAIAVGAGLGLLIPSMHVPARSLRWLLSFTYNIYVAHSGWDANVLGPLWSLSVEWQFYFAIPWIVKFGGRRALSIFLVVCLLASYGMLLLLGRAHAEPSTGVWVNSFVQFQFFAAGTALALQLHRHSWNISVSKRIVLLIGGLAILALQQRFVNVRGYLPLPASRLCCGYLLILMCGIMIFLSLFNWPLPIPKSLRYLGEISYGLYVYHTLFLYILVYRTAGSSELIVPTGWHAALVDAISLGLTILTAHVSYQYFEKPFLRLKQKFATIPSATVRFPVAVQGK
ncbi:MAG: acyltransferase [Terracidiphilus sp.]